MTDQSPIHPYIEQAKNRLDEIDASIAHFEARAQELKTDARAKADAAIAKMKSNRDAYRAWVKENQEIGEAITAGAREKLKAEWTRFEDNVMAYFDAAAGMYEQDKAYFQVRIEAQKEAWQKTMDRVKAAAKAFQAKRKAEIDAAVATLEKNAENANAKLKDLNKAGSISWTAVRDALSASRAAFDKAMDETQSAFKEAMKTTEDA
ncbi:hypothetical protein [Parasphingorhabdus sp.]|uniref:hypothetical protein n=1 Tax=Parasphingorhabdus sp. TaxID=2709688 RepID=UPI003A8ED6F2